MSIIRAKKIAQHSSYTRNPKIQGEQVNDKIGISYCKQCKGEMVTTVGGKGAAFRRKNFCSGSCAYKFNTKLAFNPHNKEMRQAKWSKPDNTKFIFNSPFRNPDGSLKPTVPATPDGTLKEGM